jgi:NhaA family Na+:H+ antiporter
LDLRCLFLSLCYHLKEIVIQDEAKFAILIASFIAAVLGFTILSMSSKGNMEPEED